jgi:hypothetical protein
MGDFMDKLSEFAQKIEKKAPLKLTEEEKKIVEEIEEWKGGAVRLPVLAESTRSKRASEREQAQARESRERISFCGYLHCAPLCFAFVVTCVAIVPCCLLVCRA